MAGGAGGKAGVGVAGAGAAGVALAVAPAGSAVGGDLDLVAADGGAAVVGRRVPVERLIARPAGRCREAGRGAGLGGGSRRIVVEDRDVRAADGCPVEIGGHGDGPAAVVRIVPRGSDGDLNRGGLLHQNHLVVRRVCIRVPRAHAVVGALGGGPGEGQRDRLVHRESLAVGDLHRHGGHVLDRAGGRGIVLLGDARRRGGQRQRRQVLLVGDGDGIDAGAITNTKCAEGAVGFLDASQARSKVRISLYSDIERLVDFVDLVVDDDQPVADRRTDQKTGDLLPVRVRREVRRRESQNASELVIVFGTRGRAPSCASGDREIRRRLAREGRVQGGGHVDVDLVRGAALRESVGVLVEGDGDRRVRDGDDHEGVRAAGDARAGHRGDQVAAGGGIEREAAVLDDQLIRGFAGGEFDLVGQVG